METPILPPPPEEVIYDLRWIARRWKTDAIVVEDLLQRGGVGLVDIPQPSKKGVRFSDLLRFEAQRRETLAAREIQREAECKEQERRQSEASGSTLVESQPSWRGANRWRFPEECIAKPPRFRNPKTITSYVIAAEKK
jgi:hypothetical protein